MGWILLIGIIAAFSIDTDKPAHLNYALVALVVLCFGCFTVYKVMK